MMKYLKYIEKIQPLWKTVWRFLKKLKVQFPYEPVIPLLGKNSNSKMYLYSLFIAVLFIIAETWLQLKRASTDNWLKNMWYIYIYIYIYIYTHTYMGFRGGSDCKESTCNAEDLDSVPGLGKSPGGGHGNPLQYSCLDSSTDRGD